MSEVKTNKISSLASNNNITIDPDGTGNTIVASGNVGIGTATPSSYNSGADDLVLATTGATGITIASGTSNNGSLFFADGTSGADQYRGYIQYEQTNNAMAFGTNGAERMRIDSGGNLLIGRTNTNNNNGGHYITSGYAYLERNNDLPLYLNRFGSDGTIAQFRRQDSVVGSISVTSSGTAFNTSSDYRLKENVTYDWDATTRLKQLKPARFNFIVNADTTVDGFLAHEVSSIIPEAISGTKDEVEVWKDGEELPDGVSAGDNKLDADGNTIPVMQGIDQSKLVPLLVKTIQELEARITALEAE
jgi:hypothetical protein